MPDAMPLQNKVASDAGSLTIRHRTTTARQAGTKRTGIENGSFATVVQDAGATNCAPVIACCPTREGSLVFSKVNSSSGHASSAPGENKITLR